MGTSLVGEQTKFAPETRNEVLSTIIVVDRKRSLVTKGLDELEEAIVEGHIMAPIGVRRARRDASGKPLEDGHVLLYGLRRLTVWRNLYDRAVKACVDPENPTKDEQRELGRWYHIPCNVYPADTPDDFCEILEITENLRRADLTTEQRQVQSARLGELYAKKRKEAAEEGQKESGPKTNKKPNGPKTNKKPNNIGRPVGTKGWFTIWVEETGTPLNTAKNWWQQFREQTGRKELTPGKATDADKAAWTAWLKSEADNKKDREEAQRQAAANATANAERNNRKLAFFALVGEINEKDSPSIVWDYLKELNPDLEITTKLRKNTEDGEQV